MRGAARGRRAEYAAAAAAGGVRFGAREGVRAASHGVQQGPLDSVSESSVSRRPRPPAARATPPAAVDASVGGNPRRSTAERSGVVTKQREPAEGRGGAEQSSGLGPVGAAAASERAEGRSG